MKNALLMVVLGASALTASAAPILIANPGGTNTEIGARIRWGGTGFEASLFDSNPALNQSPTLNPVGSPVWQLNNAYKFQVTFSSATGTLGLDVDFNRDSIFGAGESITRSVFTAPEETDYTGLGFKYLAITGNEGGSTGRSQVNNLVINGVSFGSLVPNGGLLEQYYKDSAGNVLTNVTITGDLTYTSPGTSQERPTWNFNFKDSEVPSSAVPDSSSMLALLGMGMLALAALRRKLAA